MPLHLGIGQVIGESLRAILADPIASAQAVNMLIRPPQLRSQPPLVLNVGGQGSPSFAPTVQAGGGMRFIDNPSVFEQLAPEFLGGTPAVTSRPQGGFRNGGVCSGVFHTTATGRRIANSLTLVGDEFGGMAFVVDAGRPTHFSKIGRYPKRRSHHHHNGRHHPR